MSEWIDYAHTFDHADFRRSCRRDGALNALRAVRHGNFRRAMHFVQIAALGRFPRSI